MGHFKFNLKTAPSPSMITTSPIPCLTPLTIPNGIRIQSAVLPQYTFWTDQQTHTQSNRWARLQVSKGKTIDSE